MNPRDHALALLPPTGYANFSPTGRDSEVEGEVTGAVSVVEPLGNETLLSVMVAGQEVTTRADGLVSAPLGDRVRLAPRLANLHLFDPATGAVLR